MVLKTSHKWIIAIFGIIILLGIAWFVYKSIPKSQGGGAAPVDTTTSNPGLLQLVSGFVTGTWMTNLFGGGKPKTTNNSGYTTVGNCVNGCDDGAPGRDCDGFLNSQC